MIEQEILVIVANEADDGEQLNELANQFRRGRATNDLTPGLDSQNPDVVAITAWILGELPFELYADSVLLTRLRMLVRHPDALVRFNSFGALFPALDSNDSWTQVLVQELEEDPNPGVRRRAAAAAERLRPSSDS